jgi:hypothetical protein
MSFHRVSDGRARLSTDSGGPRPRALGHAHMSDAVLGVRLGDGGTRQWGRFEDSDVRGLIPQTSLE